MTDIFEALSAEFPRDAVHWRAQTVRKDGAAALALAYLDARDVMDRLDAVCTPAGWRNSVTETPKGRLIATIEIKVGDEWIGKTDGAGDTDVEGDKGGISDALKRAAVLWGVGRYLYRMKAVWAPCATYEKGGKKYWKAWTGSPWDSVRATAIGAATKPTSQPNETTAIMLAAIDKCQTQLALKAWLRDNKDAALASPDSQKITDHYNVRKTEIEAMDRSVA